MNDVTRPQAGSLDDGRGHQAYNFPLGTSHSSTNRQSTHGARARAATPTSRKPSFAWGRNRTCVHSRASPSTLPARTLKKNKIKKFFFYSQAETAHAFAVCLCSPHRATETQRPVAEEVSVQSGQIFESKGLVSIDRSKAAALLSTTPRLQPRSSTNDLAPLHCMGWVSLRHGAGPARPTPECRRCCGSSPPGAPRSVDARISLPPNAEAQTVPLHFWAGF